MAGGGLGGSEQLAMRGGSIDPYLVIARRNAPKQSMLLADVDCFAALAMTIGGRVRETAGRLHHGKSAQWYPLYRRHIEPAATRISAPIAREKQIKGGSREKKVMLIEMLNPSWRDLYEDIV